MSATAVLVRVDSVSSDFEPIRFDLTIDHFIRVLHNERTHNRQSVRDVESALAAYVCEPVTHFLRSGKSSMSGELRQVTVLFIALPDFKYDTQAALQSNQNAFASIQSVTDRFDGVMRQVIQDDKGTVCIIAFGLPYRSHEDDPLRAVMSAIVMQKTLSECCQHRCAVGISTGDVYCGVVGNHVRCEYAIVGDSVQFGRAFDGKVRVRRRRYHLRRRYV